MDEKKHLYQALKAKSEDWDFFSSNKEKEDALEVICFAAEDYLDGYHPDFEKEIASLNSAMETKSLSIHSALDLLSKHALNILRSWPQWDEKTYQNRKNFSDQILRQKLSSVLLRGAKRSNLRQNKKWNRFRKIITFRWSRNGGRPLYHNPALLWFCNSICVAYLNSGGPMPATIYEVEKHEHADLLNLLSDCLKIIAPDTEINEVNLLRSLIKEKLKN